MIMVVVVEVIMVVVEDICRPNPICRQGSSSSFHGPPQITSGSTEEGSYSEQRVVTDPNYQMQALMKELNMIILHLQKMRMDLF